MAVLQQSFPALPVRGLDMDRITIILHSLLTPPHTPSLHPLPSLPTTNAPYVSSPSPSEVIDWSGLAAELALCLKYSTLPF